MISFSNQSFRVFRVNRSDCLLFFKMAECFENLDSQRFFSLSKRKMEKSKNVLVSIGKLKKKRRVEQADNL